MTDLKIEAVFNQGEALLWLAISLAILIHTIVRKLRRFSIPPAQLPLIPAFALFGLSDLIEAKTGAWWRPWWLLALKALCILVFLFCLFHHLKKSRKTNVLLPLPPSK